MNTYTVIDRQNNEIIGKELIYTKVAELVGIKPMAVYKYAVNKMLAHNRYEIVVDGQTVKTRRYFPPELLKEWNEVHRAAEILKTGKGKIVTKVVNGKVIKCVEVIK